jgi:lysosomal acid lipase/cholesteryl ester hydrolase
LSFRKWDYGPADNLFIYGQADPPSYDLNKILVPVSVWYGDGDWLIDAADAEHLVQELPNAVGHRVDFEGFTHSDFIMAMNADKLVYGPVMEELEAFLEADAANIKFVP